ncbi:MAG TPA: thiamine phosphate synthase [Acidocella sp.]|nr:MAG: thiamine phosphate synthase [Acidocella sp. 20-58-15]HQT40455.1 thiamine phosphate synthase [Acidocella sp.]
MDQGLLTWARQVKQRRRRKLPILWLFTDAVRLPDPLPSIKALPPGISGVVLRHDSTPGRAALGQRIAKLCKARRIALVVAGDARLAAHLHAGVHLRGGHAPGYPRPQAGLRTASAHNVTEIIRARRAKADIIFISPAFPTASHPGGRPWGPCRWRRLAACAKPAKAYALGGITGQTIKQLAGFSCGAASIKAMSNNFSL